MDGYYKHAKNQLDDGLFGQSLILSAFNYRHGEFMAWNSPASYTDGGFSAYANFAYSVAKGEDWDSAQFLFDPADLAYVKNHWIYLDHDQERHRLVRRVVSLEGIQPHQHARLCGRALRQWFAGGRRRHMKTELRRATRFPTARPFRPITPSTAARNKAFKL